MVSIITANCFKLEWLLDDLFYVELLKIITIYFSEAHEHNITFYLAHTLLI